MAVFKWPSGSTCCVVLGTVYFTSSYMLCGARYFTSSYMLVVLGTSLQLADSDDHIFTSMTVLFLTTPSQPTRPILVLPESDPLPKGGDSVMRRT